MGTGMYCSLYGVMVVCSILLRLYTSTEGLEIVYLCPQPIHEMIYFREEGYLYVIYNFYILLFFLKQT
jgi:hypothetical protein